MHSAALLTCLAVGLGVCSGGGALPTRQQLRDDPPFNATVMNIFASYFLKNINIGGKGGVVASPDTTVPSGGSYYYHWMRDGGLSMRAVWLNRNSSLIPNADALMKSYISFTLCDQSQSDPHGIDIRGEPKFNLPNCDVFQGGWCRPQNDGAGIRATTMIMYANDIMADQKDYVTKYLWTSDGSYNGGAIKFNLDYVAGAYKENTCDLWEEVQSTDFFWNRMNHRRALLLGAQFAQSMGDSQAAATYTNAAQDITSNLPSHWTGQFIMESQNRQKDAAVICALNNGYAGDGVFGPTDSRVAATISAYNDLFFNAYPINAADNNRGVPGILYGRYEGDHYENGNPWILTTANLAELYYRGAQETLARRTLPDAEAMTHFRKILGAADDAVFTVEEFGRALVSQGDGVLLRIKYHVAGAGYRLFEQLDKVTGYEISAYDLTWSYASVIEAMRIRGNAVSLL
eukprot:m.35368 g.35368  ORF g.35368 m.35368 type:complete len:459 (+) comp13237_c0_seq2:1233-2609(+)